MSKFIINNIPINSISGPVSLYVLKPKQILINEYKKYDTRPPYILAFGDDHFSKKGECEDCSCRSGKCCYTIDDKTFLNLFDETVDEKHQINIFSEKSYQTDPEKMISKNTDESDYLSSFIYKYSMCYSKTKKGSQEYFEKCPTKNINWHFVDTRYTESGNSIDKKIYDSIKEVVGILQTYFDKDKPVNIDTTIQKKLHDIYMRNEKGYSNLYYLIVNGPEYIKELTNDHNFLFIKQIKKLNSPELKNIEFWKPILTKLFYINVKEYVETIGEDPEILKSIARSLTKLLLLMSTEEINTEDDIAEMNNLVKEIKKNIVYDMYNYLNPMHILNLFGYISGAIFIDIYTIARLLKQPVKDNIKQPLSYVSILYMGEQHIQNICKVLTEDLGYEYVDQTNQYTIITDSNNQNQLYNEGYRCLKVSHIDFNLLKIKEEYN